MLLTGLGLGFTKSFRRMHIFAPAVRVHEMDMSDMATGKFVFEMDVSY
jgi:hypothetical protein